MGELLGAGGYGEVHRAMWKGTEVAVKTITSEVVTKEMQKNFIDEVSSVTAVAVHENSLFGTLPRWHMLYVLDKCNVMSQVRVMTALRHPNVVLFMAACTKPPKMCIVMEFMSLGSLYDVCIMLKMPFCSSSIPFGQTNTNKLYHSYYTMSWFQTSH